MFWRYALGQWAHFVAEKEGTPVGHLGFFYWDGRATEVNSVNTRRDLQVQEPLHVAAMMYARELGCTQFDLGGAGTPGIGQFKEKFGGEIEWITSRKL